MINLHMSYGGDALRVAGVNTLQELTMENLRFPGTPDFGSMSLARLTLTLRDEVLRLQTIVDNVEAALKNP